LVIDCWCIPYMLVRASTLAAVTPLSHTLRRRAGPPRQVLGAIVGTCFAKVIAGAARFDNVYGGANTLARNVSAGQAIFGEVSRPQFALCD
jgi:hypothetical protein